MNLHRLDLVSLALFSQVARSGSISDQLPSCCVRKLSSLRPRLLPCSAARSSNGCCFAAAMSWANGAKNDLRNGMPRNAWFRFACAVAASGRAACRACWAARLGNGGWSNPSSKPCRTSLRRMTAIASLCCNTASWSLPFNTTM